MSKLATSPLPRLPVINAETTASTAPANWPFNVAALPGAMRMSLRLDPSVAKRVGQISGYVIDQSINSVTGTNHLSLRLGPDEWLLIDVHADQQSIDELATILTEWSYSLVDISHRQVAFSLTGARVRDILNCGCPLDLSEIAFPVGTATRTVLGKAEIILLRAEASGGFRLECWRSFGRYVLAHLNDSARLLGAVDWED
ncbi:MAG: sarcosine oxidase subunit gamma [Hyphomicrobiaceae bacterium]